MNRARAVATDGPSLVLMCIIGYSIRVPLIFPAWVVAVSIGSIVRNLRFRHDLSTGTAI